jgi:hypothetical protein
MHLGALRTRIGDESVQWGIGGSLLTNVGGADMRSEPAGAFAGTDRSLHFFRKGKVTVAHEKVPLSGLRSAETVTARFADSDVEMVLLELDHPTSPWGIVTTDEQRHFVLGKLPAITAGGPARVAAAPRELGPASGPPPELSQAPAHTAETPPPRAAAPPSLVPTEKEPTAATGSRKRSAALLATLSAVAILAAGGTLLAVTSGGAGEDTNRGAAPLAEAAKDPDVGEPVVEPAPDGPVTEDLSPGSTGSEDDPRGGTAAREKTVLEDETVAEEPEERDARFETFTYGDIDYDVPTGGGWTTGRERRDSSGKMIRDIEGPDGELVRLTYTPNVDARPDPSTVVRTRPFRDSEADEAQIMVLRDFPTDECRNRLCDDYILNDDNHGGVAVLASDSGGPASAMARKVAASVREIS